MDDEIQAYWNAHFPGCPPVGYLFKLRYPDFWLRVHTLPNSKRYPESEDEYQEIFRRHNVICSDLFSKSESLYLLLTQGSDSKKILFPNFLGQKISPIQYMTSISMQEVEADEHTPQYFFHIWSYKFHWEFGFLDELFKKVADEEIQNLLLVDTYSHYLYYPYDGGADIIFATIAERDLYKTRYETWLSNRQDGF